MSRISFSFSFNSCSLGFGFRASRPSFSSITKVGTAISFCAFSNSLGLICKWVQKMYAAWNRLLRYDNWFLSLVDDAVSPGLYFDS
eukprot:Skav213967  [mRNA]  locus=scaffold2200:156667:159817:- [translate_table: standard]